MEIEKLQADLLFLHAPAYFDFRKEDKIYFPFMSTSGDVPITPVYEFYPLGFKTLQNYLTKRGHDVKIFNLCSYMLQNPDVDVKKILEAIEVKVLGIDLHWLIHVQGALKIAELFKKIHPDTYIQFGGISSSYYADELIRYPFVDFVMTGYDTHVPMEHMLREAKGGNQFEKVPNLYWKRNGQIHKNPFDYQPRILENEVDWSDIPRQGTGLFPMLDIISTVNAGCANNCGWCGGSNRAFKRIYKGAASPVFKDEKTVGREFSSLNGIQEVRNYNFYSCGNYNLNGNKYIKYIEQLEDYTFKSVNYEEYRLVGEDVLRAMVKGNKNVIITLSPESQNQRISKLAGRGHFSMEEMEKWIDKALSIGIAEVDIWFFIGMPEQDEASVYELIEYCKHLLKKFQGSKVVPLICPMMPVLDPGSEFFENPDKHGYRIFYRSLEEHRKGFMHASLINRLNYETKWLTREQIVHLGYKAIREILIQKGKYNYLPSSIVESTVSKLDDAVDFLDIVHKVDCIADPVIRNNELGQLSAEILKRNQEVFFHGVMNQAFPMYRAHGQRWFDYK